MTEIKAYLSDEVDKNIREAAMKKFGYRRGSISSAIEEAAIQWLLKEGRIDGMLAAIKDAAKKDSDIIAVLLFGSYARREPNYKDVDIALLFKDGTDYEKKLFCYLKLVGAAEDKAFDIVVFNTMPLEMQERVFSEGELLYASDRPGLYDRSISVMMAFNEWSHMIGSKS